MHYTANNIDILDDSLDGKTTFNATQVAAWQRGESRMNLLTELKPSKKRVLQVPQAMDVIHQMNITESKGIPNFSRPVQMDWFTINKDNLCA